MAILGALVAASGSLMNAGSVEANGTERAVVEFTETVKLLDVFLRGEYLIVHDDSKMAQGEPCLSIYDNTYHERLVVSFHCTPIVRSKADRFKVITTRRGWFEFPEVLEIQFAGSTKAHQIP
jgi:hypothetical protein